MNLYVIVQRTEIRSNLHHQNQVKYDKRHAMDKDCKNLNSCCKLELENIFISCFNNSSLHYWVTFEKNIFFFHIHWYYLKENFFYPVKTAPSPQLFHVFCDTPDNGIKFQGHYMGY